MRVGLGLDRETSGSNTGMAAKVVNGRLEIPFADETELEELAEALERLAPG